MTSGWPFHAALCIGASLLITVWIMVFLGMIHTIVECFYPPKEGFVNFWTFMFSKLNIWNIAYLKFYSWLIPRLTKNCYSTHIFKNSCSSKSWFWKNLSPSFFIMLDSILWIGKKIWIIVGVFLYFFDIGSDIILIVKLFLNCHYKYATASIGILSMTFILSWLKGYNSKRDCYFIGRHFYVLQMEDFSSWRRSH